MFNLKALKKPGEMSTYRQLRRSINHTMYVVLCRREYLSKTLGEKIYGSVHCRIPQLQFETSMAAKCIQHRKLRVTWRRSKLWII
jgi:hypothetical protein